MAIKRKLPSRENPIKESEVVGAAAATPAEETPAAAEQPVTPPPAPKAPKASFSTMTEAEDTPFDTQVEDTFDETPAPRAPIVPPAPEEDGMTEDLEPMVMDAPPTRPGRSPAHFSSTDPVATEGTAAAAEVEEDPLLSDNRPPPPPWRKPAPKPEDLMMANQAAPATPKASLPEPPQEPAELPPSFEKTPAPETSAPAAGGLDEEDNWEIGDLVELPPSMTPPPQSADPYANLSSPEESPFRASGPKVDSPRMPRWKSAPKTGGQPPEVPAGTFPTRPELSGGMLGTVLTVGLLAVVVGVGIMFFQNKEKAIEMIARWTGTLNQVAQEVPADQPPVERMKTEAVVKTAELQPKTEAEAPKVTTAEPAPAEPSSTVKVDFVDEPKADAKMPIVADGTEKMPEDVSTFAQIQEAIANKRKEKREETAAHLPDEENPKEDPLEVTSEERMRRDTELLKKTEEELKAYRSALANTDYAGTKPKPGEFFNKYATQQGNGGAGNAPQGTAEAPLQPPRMLPNPVIADPLAAAKANAKPDVRSLQDFDVAMFEPEEEHVRIPRHIKPRIGTVDFPPLEILSLVPNYGITGIVRGKQGVLLIGETVEGWELTAVYERYAEFRMGERQKIVALDDANHKP